MTATDALQSSLDASRLSEIVAEHVRGSWLHNFELRDDKTIVFPESYDYRRRCFESLFRSLFCDGSVLVLDEESGVYPALIHRAGARAVSAANVNRRSCELIETVTRFLEVEVTVLKQQLLSFYDGEPYVDMSLDERHEFLFALGRTWPLFGASAESFDAVVEACAFFVSKGLIFDWTDASWASPPPPPEYTLDEFCAALRRKFEFVTVYNGWLVVAVGKLPPDPDEDGEQTVDELEARPGTVTTARYVQHTGPASYEEFVPWFREVVCRVVPAQSTVAVVSRGDAEMLRLEDRSAWHFPRGEDGEYVGYYPQDSASAIAHLEQLRAAGAQFLVLPKPSFWWLEHYRDFGEHLERLHQRVFQDESCLVYALQPSEG